MIKNNAETMLNFIKAYSKVSIVRPGRSRLLEFEIEIVQVD